jgi:hypothetical protein
MFTLKVSEQLLQHCKKQVEQFNFGARSTANGNKEQQLTGIIGQSALMELFNLGFVDGTTGFDNGIDLVYENLNIDIKTMGRNTDVRKTYTNNFLKLQDYFNTDIYIFCSYHKLKNELTICGWIDKKTFAQKRKYFHKGACRTRNDGTTFTTFADLFEIDNIDLFEIISIEDLKIQLNNYKRKINENVEEERKFEK